MSKRIRLPWPPKKTSANASRQGDWLGKSKAAKSYKHMCAALCKQQKVQRIEAEGNVAVTVTYCPPRNGRIDWDNMAGRCKQGFDAVAEAVGVDDGRWWPVTSKRGEKVQGGAVYVEFTNETARNGVGAPEQA